MVPLIIEPTKAVRMLLRARALGENTQIAGAVVLVVVAFLDVAFRAIGAVMFVRVIDLESKSTRFPCLASRRLEGSQDNTGRLPPMLLHPGGASHYRSV